MVPSSVLFYCCRHIRRIWLGPRIGLFVVVTSLSADSRFSGLFGPNEIFTFIDCSKASKKNPRNAFIDDSGMHCKAVAVSGAVCWITGYIPEPDANSATIFFSINSFLKLLFFVAARLPPPAASSETSIFQSIPLKNCCFSLRLGLCLRPPAPKPQFFNKFL